MKRLILVIIIVFVSFVFTACEPITTEASLNTNITQSTAGIPVTWIGIWADNAEVCMGDQVTFTIEIQPSNASNQNYTIAIDTNYLNFVGTSQLLVEIVGEDSSGETMETTVTISSNDNPSITDTVQIYIHHSSSSGCTVN